MEVSKTLCRKAIAFTFTSFHPPGEGFNRWIHFSKKESGFILLMSFGIGLDKVINDAIIYKGKYLDIDTGPIT